MRNRAAASHWPFLLLVALAMILPAASPPVPAQEQGTQGTQDAQPAGDETDDPESVLSRKERKRQAKERRIAEYLRKKEEKRARRELQLPSGDQAARQAPVSQQTAATRDEPRPPKMNRALAGKRDGGLPPLPRNLARAQRNIRSGALAQDPNVIEYLDLIDRQMASPEQLAAFGNFLAQNGLTDDAAQYYDVALNLKRDNPVLWLNAGTIHRQRGDIAGAMAAYGRTLELDPNNALALYNMGAILDARGKYDEAIDRYKMALAIDPNLGDPTYNPQAANNPRLTAVKLQLYEERSGALGLPLIEVTGGAVVSDSGSDR